MSHLRMLVLLVLASVLPALAIAQTGARRPSEGMGMGGMGKGMGIGPRAEERSAGASLTELVRLRLAQLEEDLALTPAQMPLWKTYRASVEQMVDDVKRGAGISVSESTAPKRLDAMADTARNRLAAIEEIVDSGKALYARLTPQQQALADRRLALPLATLTGGDGGADRGAEAADFARGMPAGGPPPGAPR